MENSVPRRRTFIGWGGVPDNPEIRAFYKVHKEVTGVDADFNGNPLYYANNQLLTQAIEGAGSMDREAIADSHEEPYLQDLAGRIRYPQSTAQQALHRQASGTTAWFHAVGGVGYPDSDYVPAKLKTSWA